MKFSKIIVWALLLTFVLVFSGQALAAEVLHAYTALDTNEAKIYIEAFEKDTGIKVEWVRMSAGEVLTRLRAEANNPQVSLWFGGPSPEYIAANNFGLLAPYESPVGKSFLTPSQKDPDNMWTGFYFGGIGFASNTEFFKEIGLEYPTSWADLLKPELKGKISLAYPYTSGTAYTVLATLVQLMGEDEAFDYWEKLNENIHHYNKSGSACVTQVGLGEVAVGIAFSHDVIKKGPSAGYPVALTLPSEGTGFEIGAMALIKGGPEPELAKKFIDWILSKRAQELMKAWFRIPLNPEAEIVEGAIPASEINLIEFDAVWAGNNKERLIEIWRDRIGQ